MAFGTDFHFYRIRGCSYGKCVSAGTINCGSRIPLGMNCCFHIHSISWQAGEQKQQQVELSNGTKKLNMNETISSQQFREILVIEHGLIFFPKRSLVIPDIETSQLEKFVASNNQDHAMYEIAILTRYLKGEAVGDGWGNDHDGRRVWRINLYRQFGEPFLELYYYTNQFRMNNIALARLSIMDLGRLVRDASQKEQFIHLGEEASWAMDGYNTIENLNDKLKVVHVIEDKAIEAINLLH